MVARGPIRNPSDRGNVHCGAIAMRIEQKVTKEFPSLAVNP